jgi:hypothetical protein
MWHKSMNDLFASLVDRTLGRAPVLERRQPTLFEPAIDVAFSEPALQETENFVESEPPPREPKQVLKNTSPQPLLALEEPEASALETRPVRRPRVRDVPAPEENVETRLAPAPVKEATASSHEEHTHDVKPPVVAAPTMTPERTIETIVEKTIEREVIKEQTPEEPAIREIQTFTQPTPEPQPPPRDDTASTAQPSKVEVRHLPAPKQATPIKPLAPKNPARYPTTALKTRAAARAEAKRRPEPPAPIINVTIGRVEVRATTPTTSKAQAARPAGPKLSLDDYLRSRAERN